MNHRTVKGIEILEFQGTIIQKAPHPAGMGIASAIAFTRKINPFGVPPFVAHKVQVAPTGSGNRQKAYHLMQCHRAVYDKVMVKDTHSGIDFLVRKAKENGLIPHQSLIVAFRITDGALLCALVGQLIIKIPYMPLLIGHIFQELDPVVRDTHTHLIIKA